ncbi:DUF1189 family protein [Pseudogracilibacillus auburnensis]|uniref:Uncharacterized protein DUF1189 n=1 Tax=Pseudogracilibacillus auburnensis TaxID=1494959 RepID=A0A2V3VP22_9BACI|nr:DUF1189 family protein [Pseudogracilibacillus auburnensis]PXW83607.1 uncharacterized protein DUF1189 [Pseudogracilibacillus auburnensis]
MKVFWNACKQSIKLPQKQAVFALNRVGMDITVIYMFILLALASVPALLEQILLEQSAVPIQTFFLLIYFFIFYYLILVVIIFSLLSILAYIASLITKMLNRKLRFSILWKMAAFTTTLPLFLFTLFSFFYPLNHLFLIICVLYIFTVIIKIILIYPKRVRHSS